MIDQIGTESPRWTWNHQDDGVPKNSAYIVVLELLSPWRSQCTTIHWSCGPADQWTTEQVKLWVTTGRMVREDVRWTIRQ